METKISTTKLFETKTLIVRLAFYVLLAYGTVNLYNLLPLFYSIPVPKVNINSENQKDSPTIQVEIGQPTKLIIPKIGVDTKISPVGVTAYGTLDVPKSLFSVGWYKGGVKPGEVGSAVIDGHEVDAYGFGVIFKNLHLLNVGDSVFVSTKDGQVFEFEVKNIEKYNYTEAPIEKIFSDNSAKNLNLITCSGNFISDLNTKDERLVVYTTLKE